MIVLGRFYADARDNCQSGQLFGLVCTESSATPVIWEPYGMDSATLVLAPLAIAGLISAIPMLPYLRHVHREEDMLTERFGSAYAAYQLSDVPS